MYNPSSVYSRFVKHASSTRNVSHKEAISLWKNVPDEQKKAWRKMNVDPTPTLYNAMDEVLILLKHEDANVELKADPVLIKSKDDYPRPLAPAASAPSPVLKRGRKTTGLGKGS